MQRLMTILALGLLFFHDRPCFAMDRDLVRAIQVSLVADLAPALKVEAGGFTVFNYRSFSKPEKVAKLLEPGEARRVLTHAIDEFWQVAQPYGRDSLFGNGFYGAIDPFISRGFGRNDFALILVQFSQPQSLRALRLKDAKLSVGTLALIEKSKCAVSGFAGCGGHDPATTAICQLLSSSAQDCRTTGLRVLKNLQSDVLEYDFGRTNPAYCHGDSLSAFVILKKELLASATVRAFGTDLRESDDHAKTAIESAAREEMQSDQAVLGASLSVPALTSIWPGIEVSARSREEAQRWMKKELLNCH